MVPGKKQLELRHEFEKILPHEPRCDFVAAGERFDLAFVPPAAFVSLYRGDKTCPLSPARSVGCRSCVDAMNASMGAAR
jgi:hypothetical protein